MVLCLALNKDKNVKNRFIVKINDTVWNNEEISYLQDLIKEKKGNAFNKFDASDLELWKVSIHTKEVNDEFDEKLKTLMNRPHMEINIKEELNGLLLDAEDNIKDHIDKDPINNHIHIIVKPPSITAQETEKTALNIPVKDAIDMALENVICIIPINNSNDNMPLMERNFDEAITMIERNIYNNLKGFNSKADFDILVSGGAPGIGKTRFGQEIFKHLENQNYWIPSKWKNNLNLQLQGLYLDFGSSCQLDSYDDELTPTVIIGLRIAYVFFIERKYNMKFTTFRDRVWKYRNIFKISDVFNCIFEHLIVQPNQQLFVFLHIDEFQLIDQWEHNVINKRKKPEKQLFRKMINGLATFMLGPSFHIFVQTFLSGTAPQVIISTKETSKVSFGFVGCPQLTFRAMFNIANHYAQQFNAEKFDCNTYKWMLCQPFLQLLEDTGGLPRALQLLFEICFKIGNGGKRFFDTIEKQEFDTIFERIKDRIEEQYNIYGTIIKNKKLALELLYCSIDAIPVYRKTCLDVTNQNCTIENLERDAHIILNPCKKYAYQFTIMMPFFFICIYNEILQIVDPILTKSFRIQNTMYWQEWELFVAYYEAFRTNLLIERGKDIVCLGELYRGVYGTNSTKNLKVKLKKLSVCQAQEKFPCLKLTDKNSAKPIFWEKGKNVIVNGVSAKWGDSFRVLKTVKGELIFSIHQAKYGYNSAIYTLENLLNEHAKNYKSSAFTESKQLFNKLARYRHITIVFTTQPFYDTIPYNDCFVISCNNFKQYFGPVFSSRATFALTKNINPNFSDLKRMAECLPGVGDITAGEIILNRPYKSEDDFFKKHNRAKLGKEKYESENPKKKLKFDFHPFNV